MSDPIHPTAPESAGPPGAPLWGPMGAWARDLLLSVVLALVVILFLYQPVKVEGASMLPALGDQDRVFINKFTYRLGLSDVKRGDTVVFWYPNDPAKSYIKRVIGLPGDLVEVRDGAVFVNSQVLREPYMPEDYRDRSSAVAVRVQPDHFYVMGDHRSSSSDSRAWGPIPRSAIYGKAVFVYWPPARIGGVR